MSSPNRMNIRHLLNPEGYKDHEPERHNEMPTQTSQYPPSSYPLPNPLCGGHLKSKGKRQASNSPHPDSPSLTLRRKRTKPNLKISTNTLTTKLSPVEPSTAGSLVKAAGNAANTSFGLGIGGLASGTSNYINTPAADSANGSSSTKDKGPMTSLASSFGQLFHNAKEESKGKERWVKDTSSIDNETGERNARNTGEKAAADNPMGNTDDATPFDSMMASIENAEPKEPSQDVEIGSPTPPCSPVLAVQRQLPAQKGKQRLRFSMGEAIMSQNDILLNVCNYLGLKEFFDLYCVSKRFYVLVNSHYTTHIKQLAHNYAPLASTIFPYQLYKRGCIQDPMLRTRGTHPGDTTAGERSTGAVHTVTRTVPGLRWVLMCAYREALVNDMLLSLALEGHRFPAPIPEAILRIWALLDLPTNGARLAAMHDESLWETRDIFLALMFCMKLDMRFADPVVGSGECVLRRLLLGQKSLVVLWEALRGLTARTRAEVLAMVVEWDGVVPPGLDGVREVREGETLLGVPMEKVGSLSKEWWRQDGKYLLRPDELLLKEGVRRGMNIHRCFLDYMLWGYIDWTWLRPIALPDLAALELADRKRMGGDAADVSSAEEGGRKISSGSFRDMARASGVS